MILKFNLNAYVPRRPEEAFAFMKNMYRLPWHTSGVVPAYDKTTPGEVAEGTEFSERVRITRGKEMTVITRVTEVREGSCLGYEWHNAGMRGELFYRFVAEGEGTRLFQRQTIRLRGAMVLAAPFIYAAFSIKIRRRIFDLAALMAAAARPEDVEDLRDYIVRQKKKAGYE